MASRWRLKGLAKNLTVEWEKSELFGWPLERRKYKESGWLLGWHFGKRNERKDWFNVQSLARKISKEGGSSVIPFGLRREGEPREKKKKSEEEFRWCNPCTLLRLLGDSFMVHLGV